MNKSFQKKISQSMENLLSIRDIKRLNSFVLVVVAIYTTVIFPVAKCSKLTINPKCCYKTEC